MIQRIVNGVREGFELLLDIAHQHRPVTRIELGVHDPAHVPRAARMLEIVQQRCAVLIQLLTQGGNAVRVPAHRGIGSAEGLQGPIRALAHGVHPQELIQDGRDARLVAVAGDERCEGTPGAQDGQHGGVAGGSLEVRVIPPPREHSFGSLTSALTRAPLIGVSLQHCRHLRSCEACHHRDARSIRA